MILDIIGSNTPDLKLFLGLPAIRSNPQYLSDSFFSSVYPYFWEAVWSVLNFDINSVASLAALTANVFGMIFNA